MSNKDKAPQYSSPRFENFIGNTRGRNQFCRQGQLQLWKLSARDVSCHRCRQQEYLQCGCRVRFDHMRFHGLNIRTFKHEEADCKTRQVGLQINNQRHQSIGEPVEVLIKIEDIQTTAFLDTVTTLSTMAASFHEKYLSNHPIIKTTRDV